MANLQVDVNEQTAQVFGNYLFYSFNFSNTTECSNGTHTFLSVLVNTYVMNVTGFFRISWQATLGNGLTRYRYAYASGIARIGNGNFLISLLPSMIVYTISLNTAISDTLAVSYRLQC